MATGFDDVEFSVYPDGEGWFPLASPPENENGPRTWTGTVRVTNGTDLALLRNKRSIVTVVPAMGFTSGGTLVTEAGVGSKVLVVPNANGGEITYSAILVGYAATAFMLSSDRRVDLTFIIVE